MAALDFAGAVTNVKTMLSGLTAWQTICGVSSSAEAAKRIHLGGCEEEQEESLAPVIILDIDPFNTNWASYQLRSIFSWQFLRRIKQRSVISILGYGHRLGAFWQG